MPDHTFRIDSRQFPFIRHDVAGQQEIVMEAVRRNRKIIAWRCRICGRDKFQKPIAHICGTQYTKRLRRKARKLGIQGEPFEPIYESEAEDENQHS